MPRIPDLPGYLVPSGSDHAKWLKKAVSELCNLNTNRFPGAQPVSFTTADLEKLVDEDYWVCEKSDGIRVLLFISTLKDAQNVFLLDRHNNYYQLDGFYFPHYEDPRVPLKNSLIDGELVLDVDPQTRQETLRYLCFDCLVIDDQNVMTRPLDKRYGRLKDWFYKPYQRMLIQFPLVAAQHPFQIVVKETNLSYHLEQVFDVDIPALHHGNDGLIYTCVSTPYTPGTDQNILKWKPPSENSIDFKLVLRFPPSVTNPSQPDLCAKPVFALHAWLGGEGPRANYEPFDVMHVTDDEWERMKVSGEQFEDRIVEVHWDPAAEGWRMMRFRDDKPMGNHINTVESVIESIRDGVEKETLLERCGAIRTAWRTRHNQLNQPTGPPHHSMGPPNIPSALAQQRPLPPPYPRPSHPNPHFHLQARDPQSQHQHQHQQRSFSHAQAGVQGDSGQAQSHVDTGLQLPGGEIRYGPIQPSIWSRVTGPAMWGGMYR
ncbi:mRNA capping enzyme, alpha subunit [Thelephora ganbajun]|uniref:mRNA capping enzyme, alpha subunit n=1 Tax=Thelephora ganbajun TaxID=370292 RepID=A0ACB6Z715_THEGA|nr:mRNA capping enzyme, alpha subunit [Thelephora ganbajun]